MKKENYFLIVGSNSEIALEFITSNKDKNYILMDLPEKRVAVTKMIENLEVNAIFYDIDVMNVESIRAIFKIINKKYAIENLIYLAGVNYAVEALEITEDIWDHIMNVNLKGSFFVMQETAKNMIINNVEGRMINISSQHGIVGNIERAAYCASKAGLLNMNKALALEWAKHNIIVNAIAPTFVINNLNQDYLMSKKGQRDYLRKIPLGKYCTSKDVATAIEVLLSKKITMMTGSCLMLDGGWTIY